MKSENKLRIWLPFLLAVSVAVGLFIGNGYSKFNKTNVVVGGLDKLKLVFDYIDESYVDSVNIDLLVEDALPNIMHELDPHSEYFTSAEMREVNESLEGHFSGIGVSYYLLNDTIIVTGIIPGGPSEAAGIAQWDRIVYVNDTLVAGQGFKNEDVQAKLRGEKGSEVRLGVYSPGLKEQKTINVIRGEVPMKSVNASYMLTDNIGYIKIGFNFGFNTFREFISAISELKMYGANSFVIDLRGNAGGSLETVISMLNEFLNKGDLIVYTEGLNFPRMDSYANGSGTCKNDDVIVLIDELSASASEIFAGAIQDHDRGLVLGRRSFGKGLVQNQKVFSDGSAVRLTVAHYYTASGRSIQRKFEKGRYDEYEMDAIRRYINGNYSTSDSTSKNLIKFKTQHGREVYGGEGIMPDIFMSRDSVGYNSYYNSVVNLGLVEEYSMMYSDMNRNKLSEFEDWHDMYKYLKQQPLLLNLISFADNKGIRRRPYLIQESSELFENSMYAYIIRNFYGEEAFWASLQKNDKLINKSIELIELGMAKEESVIKEEYKTLY